MERSEPTLIPEWLKGATATATTTTTTTTTTGAPATAAAGSTTHHFPLHSDESGVALSSGNKSSLNNVDHDTSHSSALLDRTSSFYFRRSSSSNGSTGHEKDNYSHSHSYSSFGRSYRDRDYRDSLDFREKDRSFVADQRDRDFADADIFTNRTDKDMFRRSQSMISGKRAEVRPRRVVAEVNSSSNHNGAPGGNKIINMHKTTFERDFPSLGAEEKQGVDRVASPGLNIAAQSLLMGTSAMIMGNGWTSALAEPPVVAGNNIMVPSSVSQAAAPSLVSLPQSTTTGLNMAETLAQAPLKARTAPQVSVETQRLEELAIKQSRQLIPMTPPTPKTSVLNSDKQKPKASARSEMSMADKIVQQQLLSSQSANHPLRGGTTKSDVAKTLNGGKLLVLKAARENGLSPATNESLSPANGCRITSNPLGVVAPSVGLATIKSHYNPKLAAGERKANPPPANKTSPVEKKHTSSQAQSRSDFFNLMRKKTVTNNSSATSDTVTVTSSVIIEKSSETVNAASSQGSDVPASENFSLNADDGTVVASNGDAFVDSQRLSNIGEKHSSSEASLYPYEKEVTLLRSMGWEEDAGEEEGPFLTQEEIDDFLEKVQYMKANPSSKLCQVMGRVNGLGGGSEPSSSESESKA